MILPRCRFYIYSLFTHNDSLPYAPCPFWTDYSHFNPSPKSASWKMQTQNSGSLRFLRADLWGQSPAQDDGTITDPPDHVNSHSAQVAVQHSQCARVTERLDFIFSWILMNFHVDSHIWICDYSIRDPCLEDIGHPSWQKWTMTGFVKTKDWGLLREGASLGWGENSGFDDSHFTGFFGRKLRG